MLHKKNLKKISVKTVEMDDQGEVTFNLASTAANNDWIRAARLKKWGKKKQLDKLNKLQMYYYEDEYNEKQ